MIYTSSGQASAVVPYGITGSSALVAVTYQGQTSAGFSVPIVPSAPGIFTADSTGKGQAAAVNQDGSLNSAASPAHPSDVITLFATGEGQTSPPAPMANRPLRRYRSLYSIHKSGLALALALTAMTANPRNSNMQAGPPDKSRG